jgi:hypothetical protein
MTNWTEQNPWQANGSLASQEIPRILWNSKTWTEVNRLGSTDLDRS